MNGKTEIYRLSYSVRIFKCFKWDVFNAIFSTKNETMLELFNFYGTLCPKYLTKMYLNQYKQNKTIVLITTMVIIVKITKTVMVTK